MKNKLLETELPKINAYGTMAVDAQWCEMTWIEGGREPEHLADFLKLYPAGYYLSWVRAEIGNWYAQKMIIGDSDNLKLLGPGLHGGKNDSGLRQLVTDFAIYRDVEKMKKKYKVLSHNYTDSVFCKLQKKKDLPWKKFFAEKKSKGKLKKIPITASTISERYYRFRRFWEDMGKKQEYSFKKALFIDNKMLICGPTRIDQNGKSGFGIWQINPETGFMKGDFMGYLLE